MENTFSYLTLRDKPELKDAAAEWFSSKWCVPREAYLECMDSYLNHQTELGWYLCMDGNRIIGGLGVIENDFHDRKDLSPNVCAVYTEMGKRCWCWQERLLLKSLDERMARIFGFINAYLLKYV